MSLPYRSTLNFIISTVALNVTEIQGKFTYIWSGLKQTAVYSRRKMPIEIVDLQEQSKNKTGPEVLNWLH